MLVLGSLVGVRILTELLPPSSYGELALGMTLAILVNQVILGPLGGGILRFYAPASESGDLAGYLYAVKKLTLLATGLILLVMLLTIIGLVTLGRGQWLGMAASTFLFAIFSGHSANFNAIQAAARQRAIVAIHQGVEPLLRALVASVLLVWLGMTSTIAMTGFVGASLLVLGSQLFFFQKNKNKIESKDNKQNWQNVIWKFSWPSGAFGVFTWLQISSDRWALQLFNSISDVGNYVVLYQLGYYPISLLAGMATQFLIPILYQRAGDASSIDRNNNAIALSKKLALAIIGITVVVSAPTFLLHSLIFKILVAQEYGLYSYLLPWMILSGGLFAATQSLTLIMQIELKMHKLMIIKIMTALIGTVFNFVGAYWYGTAGIVGAGLAFSMLYLFWMMAIVRD